MQAGIPRTRRHHVVDRSKMQLCVEVAQVLAILLLQEQFLFAILDFCIAASELVSSTIESGRGCR